MRSLLALLAFGGMLGCGDDKVPTYPVSGTVSFSDGSPVRTGTIELESMDSQTTASGTIQEDGSFVLGTYASNDGAAAGRHRAIVVQIIVNDGMVQHSKDHGRRVDPKYASYETSSLVVEVEAKEQNDIQVILKD